MTSWVHLFSKFTSEALLFQAALICFLASALIAYSVVRKRRRGQADEVIPSSVVKVYLNELITDAEQMRSQLFGLLHSSGIMVPGTGNSEAGKAARLASIQASAGAIADLGDSDLLLKISTLEARMKEQARAMELLIQEKTRIESELSLAKTSASSPSPGSHLSADATEFKKKIAQLEAKLAEYSVIEDDLANLKRLQQENSELKSRLGQPTAPSPAIAPTAVAAVSAAAASLDASLEKPAGNPGFDQLAPQVEASLAEKPAAEGTVQSAAAPAADPAITSEADLLAEFEKMLNG